MECTPGFKKEEEKNEKIIIGQPLISLKEADLITSAREEEKTEKINPYTNNKEKESLVQNLNKNSNVSSIAKELGKNHEASSEISGEK